MKFSTRLFSGFLCLTLLSASVASADFLEDRRAGINKKQQKEQPPKAFGNKGLVPPSFDKWNQDPNLAVCASGDTSCVDPNYDSEKIEPTGSNRLANFNNYGSMLGFQAGMNSPFHVDATIGTGSGTGGTPGYLNGELTLAYITMGLTEPAVAAGLAQAVNYVGHDVSNRLAGEQVFFSQLNYMPDVSQNIGQLYVACIAKKTQAGENWLTAQAACSGDTTQGLTAQKGKFIDASGGASILAFDSDPNYDTSTGTDPKTILLSNYLFFRDSNLGSATNGPKLFKQSFIDYIGDIRYTLDDTSSQKLGTRELTYVKLPANKKFSELFKEEAANKVLNAMLTAFEQACQTPPPGASDATPEQADPFLRQLTSSPDDDWADFMSYPGFAPDSNLMRMLWQLTADTSTGTCPNSSGPWTGNYDDYKWDQVINAGNNAPETSRDYMYIAERIAFGRLYSLFMLAEDYLRKLNVGPFDSFARRGAFELLYDAAGTTDMHAMYDQNTVALREYFELLGKRTAMHNAHEKTKTMGGAPSQQGAVKPYK